MLTSSSLPSRFEQRPEQLQSAGKVLGDVKEIIGECSSKIYYIIPQPSTSSSDLKTSAPHLKAAIADKSVKGRYTVSEVVGLETSSSAELVSTLVSKCGAVPMSHEAVEEGKTVFVEFENGVGELGHIGISLPLSFQISSPFLLSTYTSANLETKTDATEHSTLFKSLSHSLPYTVLYLTTPNPHPTSAPHEEMLYEPAFEEPVHMELKRQLEARIPPKTTTNDTRPLFEKYQFFTPGTFLSSETRVLLSSLCNLEDKLLM